MALCLYFCLSYGWYFYITWLPTYLREGRHLEIVSTAMFGIIPLFFGGLGNPASVLLASRLVRANGDVARTRRIVAYLGFTGASAFLILSTMVNDPMWAVLAIGMASFSNDLVMPGSWAAAMDVGGKYAGSLSGTNEYVGNISGAICPMAIGFILKWTNNNWNLTFYTFRPPSI